MSVLMISDIHLGHESTAIKRGFKDAAEMFEYLKERWNSVVHKRDLVYKTERKPLKPIPSAMLWVGSSQTNSIRF